MNNPFEKTFCNPISFPNYAYAGKDWGYLQSFLPVTGRWQKGNEAKFNAPIRPYRSLSDPDVMYYDGKWYLYASADCCYVTEDMLHWEAHPLLPHRFDASAKTINGKELNTSEKRMYEIQIAVTAAAFGGRIYMTHCSSALYASDSPFGPFEEVGNFTLPNGEELWVNDPALFEDNGRLYLYFGCGIETGIQGVELDPQQPNRLLHEPMRIVEFRPESGWECTGARYQDTSTGWIEGCDMFKHNGRYYLTYAANGTTYDTYNMGIYYSDESPLSGFRPQEQEPFCEKKEGICRGAGHGCVTEGPNGSIWVFYTSVAATTHMYERRIGMDKVIVNEKGELTVRTTDYPQWAPGITGPDVSANGAGIRALNHQNPAWATSAAPGRDPFYVTDESMITWWQPDEGDDKRQLVVDLRGEYMVYASRILWKEGGFDEEKEIVPGAVQYKIEITDNYKSANWKLLLDMSKNQKDYLNDYRTFEPKRAAAARLTITGTPEKVDIGVISFVLFGQKE